MKKPKVFRPKTLATKKFKPKVKEDRAAKQALYNCQEWTTYRFRYLHHNPLCYSCGSKSQVVDHLLNHKGDETLFWDKMNFIPLCSSCHSTVTALFDRHDSQRIEGKMKWLEEKRGATNTSVRVKIVELKNKFS